MKKLIVLISLVAVQSAACPTEFLNTKNHQAIDQAFEEFFGEAECTTYEQRCAMLSEVGAAVDACAAIKKEKGQK